MYMWKANVTTLEQTLPCNNINNLAFTALAITIIYYECCKLILCKAIMSPIAQLNKQFPYKISSQMYELNS